MAKNETYNRLIHTMKWLQLRKHVLNKHPLCQMCEQDGRVSAATEVHHLIPCETAGTQQEMETLMFDVHNVMALCHRCHVQIHMMIGKGGKEERRKRADKRLQNFVNKFFPSEEGP